MPRRRTSKRETKGKMRKMEMSRELSHLEAPRISTSVHDTSGDEAMGLAVGEETESDRDTV